MALLSLGFLLLAIMLGFIRKMNTGLLCIAFALLLGRMAGISDAEIIKGFNASLFLMLLGVLICSVWHRLTAVWIYWHKKLFPWQVSVFT